ncbi:YheC/YheD family protein [Longirhabdus pacifica]|uniref:YheC/YheD family protein n=1 Tax=Longirhabdus pacifica TaxID=2305227 RepID=UPI001008E2D1|nr:YheC/YheD family protein [Longirhabdus pacifica]
MANPYSKWEKAKLLYENEKTKVYSPEVRKFSKKELRIMLNKYGVVYVKPIFGGGGSGVIKVSKVKKRDTIYQFHYRKVIRAFTTFAALFKALQRQKLDKPYMIQKGIHLMRYGKRPSDIRVMMQKSNKKWELTGVACRVARPKKIITNACKGSTVMSFHTLMKNVRSEKQIRALSKKIYDLSMQSAHILGHKYPALKEIGIDLGLDTTFKPWIIETNAKPRIQIFYKLNDKRMLRHILRKRREK